MGSKGHRMSWKVVFAGVKIQGTNQLADAKADGLEGLAELLEE